MWFYFHAWEMYDLAQIKVDLCLYFDNVEGTVILIITLSFYSDDRGPAVTRMRRLSHHMTQDGLQAGLDIIELPCLCFLVM